MLLSDKDIKKEIKRGAIVIRPRPNFALQLSSCLLDLRLGYQFRVFQYAANPFIDIKKEIPDELTTLVTLKKNGRFILQPGEFALASTEEWIELADNVAARLEGRSSIGRLGVIVHATASIVTPGWRGNLTLELGNIGRMPVALYPGMRICALSFEYLTSASETPYYKSKTSKYKNSQGVVSAKKDSEFD